MLAQTLTILALSTPFMSANFMMSRVFYANEDARTPLYVQLWLAVIYVVGAFFIQFLPVDQIIYAIAILYTLGNILSVVISVSSCAACWGTSTVRGSSIPTSAWATPVWGSRHCRCGCAVAPGQLPARRLRLEQPPGRPGDGHRRRACHAAVYLVLLRVFHVTELRDLLRPLMGRLGRRSGGGSGAPAAAPAAAATAGASASGASAGTAALRRPTPERATVSSDTGLIPRISGEFDSASFRAGPAPQPEPEDYDAATYLPEEDVPGTARGKGLRGEIPLPGRRTYQGTPGQNPHFPSRRRKKK
jgi:putative peptidoglycan lipid II flippase